LSLELRQPVQTCPDSREISPEVDDPTRLEGREPERLQSTAAKLTPAQEEKMMVEMDCIIEEVLQGHVTRRP
jgi:hypothetical protein